MINKQMNKQLGKKIKCKYSVYIKIVMKIHFKEIKYLNMNIININIT